MPTKSVQSSHFENGIFLFKIECCDKFELVTLCFEEIKRASSDMFVLAVISEWNLAFLDDRRVILQFCDVGHVVSLS